MRWSVFQLLLCTAVVSAVKNSDSHHVDKRQVVIYTSNSNYNYAPQFAQSTYSFTMGDCTAGALVAILTATNPVNTNLFSGNGYFYGSNGYNNVFGVSLGTNGIAYDADANLPLTSTNVAVNYQTGQINLATTIYQSFTFNYRAINSYGATVVPVTIACNATQQALNAINTVCFNNVCFSNSSGTINTASGTNIARAICFDGVCYGGSSSSSSSSQSGSFSTGYTCTTSTCTSGAAVCTVSSSGANTYGITSGSGGFTVSSAGAITLTSGLSAGTYSIVVAAYNSSGSTTTTSTTTVGITVSCATSSSSSSSTSSGSFYINSTCLYGNCIFNYTSPSFSQSVYSFTQSNCSGGQTIGTVMASNAAGYFIETGAWSNYFIINSATGVITSVGTVPTGTIATLTVTAYNNNGVSTSVPVSINYSTCSSTASTTTTTTAASASTATTTAGSFSFTPTFGQTSYNFSLASCTANTVIGQVTASGATTFSIAGPNNLFTISSSGLISTLNAPPAGTYYTSVTATNATTGASTSVPVIITVTCGGSSTTTFTFASTVPTTVTTCTAGSTLGTVTATNAVAYGIDGGSTLFTINSTTGQLSLLTAITSGTYTIPVRAFGTTGTAVQNVVVTFSC
ncbi:mucin-21-like [Paramacrobiotus metropolitanus]|uniref:mucin-21-like n=1 Tax=Paramacrobiotus metropolitanus TaxID=2943436 RepID=UPI0024463DC5|nr:mucin-21-like [Paramacrobiotus metropolitanus]